jgi:hypothetical protein
MENTTGRREREKLERNKLLQTNNNGSKFSALQQQQQQQLARFQGETIDNAATRRREKGELDEWVGGKRKPAAITSESTTN